MAKHLLQFPGIKAVLQWDGPTPVAQEIGRSRQGRPVVAYQIGDGPLRVSLVGGCHADEPVGPRFLAQFVRYLAGGDGAGLRDAASWHVIPHLNPDGAAANAAWQTPGAEEYDLIEFLRHRQRELPGDDIEFGFPRSPDDTGARPENLAAADFWRRAGPFHLHASLHGMSVAAGPYFLLEHSWWPRFESAARHLAGDVRRAGYALHDVERQGEKGFRRLAGGFCSRPGSRTMRQHFLDRGEPRVADRFRPSSMECVRSLGGDPLTLVTEMPLFLVPGVGRELGPPDPALVRWQERIGSWEARLRHAERADAEDGSGDGRDIARVGSDVAQEAAQAGVAAMPVRDQMRFQWAFLCQGLALVAG